MHESRQDRKLWRTKFRSPLFLPMEKTTSNSLVIFPTWQLESRVIIFNGSRASCCVDASRNLTLSVGCCFALMNNFASEHHPRLSSLHTSTPSGQMSTRRIAGSEFHLLIDASDVPCGQAWLSLLPLSLNRTVFPTRLWPSWLSVSFFCATRYVFESSLVVFGL